MLLVTEPRDEPVARRLEAELSTLGMEATLTRPPPSAEPIHQALPRMARERGAVAALFIVPSQGRAQLWLTDRVTGKTTLREVALPASGEVSELLTLRALELLRASLLELRVDPPPSGEVPPPREVLRLLPPPPPAPPPPSPLGLAIGPAAAWSPGGTGTSFHPWISARWMSHDRVGPELLAVLPTLPSSIETSDGKATLSKTLLALGFRLSLPAGPLAASAGGGAGLAWLSTEGVAKNASFLSSSDTSRSALFYASGGLAAPLSPRVRLGAETLVAVTTARHRIDFGSRAVASWGQPIVAAAILVDLRFL